MRTREINHDRTRGRFERGRPFVAEAAEDEPAAGGERPVVGDERRHVGPEARIERRGGFAREGVGAQRDELELWMREHPVEHLRLRVAGGAEDGSRDALSLRTHAAR